MKWNHTYVTLHEMSPVLSHIGRDSVFELGGQCAQDVWSRPMWLEVSVSGTWAYPGANVDKKRNEDSHTSRCAESHKKFISTLRCSLLHHLQTTSSVGFFKFTGLMNWTNKLDQQTSPRPKVSQMQSVKIVISRHEYVRLPVRFYWMKFLLSIYNPDSSFAVRWWSIENSIEEIL